MRDCSNADSEFIHIACPICGADDPSVRWCTDLESPEGSHLEQFFRCTNTHYGRFGRIVRCRRCGMMYRDPQERDLLAAYASAVDEEYVDEWPARQATFQRSLQQLHRFIQPPGKLLDVGCSTGFFLRVAQEAGWDAVGLEPSDWAVKLARQEGLEVHKGTLEAHPFQPGQFDAVTLWDVIEHVRDPAATLRAAYELLRPGGVIGLTTMDSGSLVARLLGARWPHLMRMHLCYFQRRHVMELLRKTGFEKPVTFPHVRLLSADYLASRLCCVSDGLARAAGGTVRLLRMQSKHVPIRLGDLIAVYARKPE